MNVSKLLGAVALSTLVVFTACAQKSPRVTADGTVAKVSYGQPSKRDRKIFGELVPFGQVWRTGANEATEITFKRDVIFGGTKVKAGTYALFTIPTATEWTVILNSKLGQWGSYEYEKQKALDVASVKVQSSTSSTVQEKLTLTFKAVGSAEHLVIAWDTTTVEVEIK